MPTFIKRSRIQAPAALVFQWHTREGALQRLTPPWIDARLIARTGKGLEPGSRVVLSMPIGPLRVRWVAEHRELVDGVRFKDVALSGPFARWEHTHSVEPDGPDACFLEDRIEYSPPLGALGQALAGPMVRSDLARVFSYRHDVTRRDCEALATHKGASAMKILITGSNGLVGEALIPFLTTQGHSVTRLVRKAAGEGEITWRPDRGEIDVAAIEAGKFDAVIHLAGDGIANGRWSPEKKQRIRDSRIQGTTLLSETLAKLKHPPKVLLSASAIGYYGNRGEEELVETSSPGVGFLPDTCRAWEDATLKAKQAGIRVVNYRIGVVLSPKGGALAKMLTPFKMGVAGRMSFSGSQWWSWIAIDDLIAGIQFCLTHDEISGPVNATAPQPERNRDFTAKLKRALGGLAAVGNFMPLPWIAARILLGEMVDDALFGSARVIPARLQAAGFKFAHPELQEALKSMLGAHGGHGHGDAHGAGHDAAKNAAKDAAKDAHASAAA